MTLTDDGLIYGKRIEHIWITKKENQQRLALSALLEDLVTIHRRSIKANYIQMPPRNILQNIKKTKSLQWFWIQSSVNLQKV